MREREEKKVDVARSKGCGIGINELKTPINATQRRNDLRQRFTRMGTRGHHRERDPRMSEEEFNKSFAGIARRADDADIHGRNNLK
jgi:hypothetical protein